MRTVTKWIAIPILAVAIVPFLAEWHAPLGSSDAGIAYAKGGGGGGGGGGNGGGGGQGGGGTDGGGRGAGSDHGGGNADSGRGGESAGAGMGHGHEGRGVGGAVSEAATTAAHMSKQDIEDAGFKNRGEAVSTAVHDAQEEAREGEDAAGDNETGATGATTPSATPTTNTRTTNMQP